MSQGARIRKVGIVSLLVLFSGLGMVPASSAEPDVIDCSPSQAVQGQCGGTLVSVSTGGGTGSLFQVTGSGVGSQPEVIGTHQMGPAFFGVDVLFNVYFSGEACATDLFFGGLPDCQVGTSCFFAAYQFAGSLSWGPGPNHGSTWDGKAESYDLSCS